MEIKRIPIVEVEPWEKNPRGILKRDFERLKRQIQELGVYKPLIAVRENGKYIVLGGNMRIRALKELGQTEVEVSIIKAKTEADRIKYALSDNDRAGYYEEEALAELVYPHLDEIKLEDFKIDLGEAIDLKQVVERYGPDINDGADDVLEIDDTPAVTKNGDLFTLGRHRLMCGDSTEAEDVARLMRGEKADMVFTDPPYGVSYSKKNTFLNAADNGKRIQTPIEQDNVSEKNIMAFWKKSFEIIRDNLADVNSYYIFGPQIQGMMMMMMQESGLPYRHVIIWVKNNHVLGRCDYHYRHEPLFFGWTKTHKFYGNGKFHTSVWEVDKPLRNDLHPTMKPIALPECAMLNSSADGAIILDPFLGSGTTLIAAEKTGRICYGMEIDPKYCDVIIKRYADYVDISEEGIRATRKNPVG